jgi:6-phosphogluconolactonase
MFDFGFPTSSDFRLKTENMDTILKILQNQNELATDLAGEIAALIRSAASSGKIITIALSGGNTPKLLFTVLSAKYGEGLPWENVHFFWGDERCVPPHDPESNFGMTNRILLEKISIPHTNIHRIIGEDDPENEAARYSGEILKFTRLKHGLPVFDLIILGLGDDGQTGLLTSEKICEVAFHPLTGQKRITLTGRVINNAETVIFLVAGLNKAEVVADIIEKPGITDYPAAAIEPADGTLKWYLDADAASMLGQWA